MLDFYEIGTKLIDAFSGLRSFLTSEVDLVFTKISVFSILVGGGLVAVLTSKIVKHHTDWF